MSSVGLRADKHVAYGGGLVCACNVGFSCSSEFDCHSAFFIRVDTEAARQSLVASFASGVSNDKASVHAALMRPWSNGHTERQINKLKLVKLQMYGRAKIDLLQTRLIGAS